MDKDKNRGLMTDLREETLVTRHPGYVSSEQVVHDLAAERRIRIYQIYRALWSLLGLIELLLLMRFGLRMIAANPDSGFTLFIYGLSGMIVGPFNGMVETPVYAGLALEITTLMAMAFYLLAFWGIAFGIRLLLERSGARTFTRITREQTPGGEGNLRTTRMMVSSGNMPEPEAVEWIDPEDDGTTGLPKLLP